MTRKSDSPSRRRLAISLALSGLLAAGAVLWIDALRWGSLVRGLLWPLLRLHLFILLGLVAGQVIEIMGWTRHLGALARPLFRFGHLDDRCGVAFATAWFSGAAANAMLQDFYKEEKISRRQLFLTNLLNQLPSYFLHLPTTFFVILPMTGAAGAVYMLLTLLAALLRTAGFLLVGRAILPEPQGAPAAAATGAGRRRAEGVLEGLRRRLPKRMMGIAVYVIPIYVLVFVLDAAGGFDAMRSVMTRHVATAVVPVESLSVVVLSFAAEFTSGFAAAGALMDAGVLTVKQTVLALLIGNVLAFPVRALRHQLPRYMGIFAPKLGAQIVLLGQGCRVVSLAAVGAVYLALG